MGHQNSAAISISAFSRLNLAEIDDVSEDLKILRCWYRDHLAIGWCTTCRDYHIHGVEPAETMTAREAHCGDGLRTTYLLDVSLGDVPPEVDRDRRRKRPRGPREVQS